MVIIGSLGNYSSYNFGDDVDVCVQVGSQAGVSESRIPLNINILNYACIYFRSKKIVLYLHVVVYACITTLYFSTIHTYVLERLCTEIVIVVRKQDEASDDSARV